MLKLNRYRPRDAYPECAVRPQAVGPRAGGYGLAHDRRPLGGDPRCCEPARLEGSGGNSLDQRGEWLRLAGLAHVRGRTSGVPTQGLRPTTPAVKWLRAPMTSAPMPKPVEPSQLARMLLDWYDRHRRRLPWRAAPGVPSNPYRVWLSEIMLQQTTVSGRRGLLSTVSGALADPRGADPGRARRRAPRLARARLLRPRPQPARLRAAGAGRSRRALPARRKGVAGVAGDRALHRCGDRSHCIRPAGDRRRRQCRAGDGAPAGDRDSASGGETQALHACRRTHARDPAGRLRASTDGSRCDRLHPA